jgi:hypothetical protein
MAQAIVTKYFGATETKGSRIQVKSWLGTKYYSYDYAAERPHTEAFNQWLKETNERMIKQYGSECPHDGYFKLVSQEAASMPDDSGYCFIIE